MLCHKPSTFYLIILLLLIIVDYLGICVLITNINRLSSNELNDTKINKYPIKKALKKLSTKYVYIFILPIVIKCYNKLCKVAYISLQHQLETFQI